MSIAADRTVAVELLAKVSDYVRGQELAATATERTAVAMREAAKAQTQLEASQRRVSASTAAATKAAAAHEAATKKQLAAMTTLGRGLLTFGAAAGLGFGIAVKAATDFNKRMALVGTLAKSSPTQLKQLSDAALTVGQQFGYTAGQVSDAEAELVKAGLSVQQVLGGGLTGALTLAAAAQTDVATATTLAVSAMTQFGLQANQVSHVADLLAAGADKALGSATDLGLGLEHLGTTAHQFGFSIEETVGVLAEFAQQGQIGQIAGTELNSMLVQLSGATDQARALMKQYGFSIYDASGNTKSFAAIADNLRTSFSGLTQEQRNAAFATLFGTRAVRAANILYAGGGDAVRSWTAKVNDSGFAAGQATGKLNSLSGDLQKFKAVVTSDLIQAGDQSTGTFRDMVQGLTAVARAFGEVNQFTHGFAVDITAIAAVLGLAGGAALIAIPKYVQFRNALRELQGQALQTAEALNVEAGAAARSGVANGAAGGSSGRLGGAARTVGALGIIGTIAAVGASGKSAIDASVASRVQTQTDALAADPGRLAAARARQAQLAAQIRAIQTQPVVAGKGGAGAVAGNIAALQGQYETLTKEIKAASTAQEQNANASAIQAASLHLVAGAANATKVDIAAFDAVLQHLAHRFDVKAAQDAMTQGFRDLGKQAKESGTAVHGNSAAAIANRTALRGLYGDALNIVQAYADQTDAGGHAVHTQDQVAAKARQVARDFQTQAGKAGFVKGKVDDYVAALKKVPPTVRTSINIDISNAERALGVLQGQINKLRSLDLPNAGRGPANGWAGGTMRAGRIRAFSGGGTIAGAPSGRDTFLTLLDNGEEVISNRHGQADRWRPVLKAINARKMADGGTAGQPNLADIFSLIQTTGGTKKHPLTAFATQFSAASIKTVSIDAAFLANLRRLGDMGFGYLALQLLQQNDHTARVIAAQAVRWPAKKLRATQGALQASAAEQKQLGLLPAELAISSALRTSRNPTLASIAAATGLDITSLQAGLQAMSKSLGKNKNAGLLLRGLNTVGSFQTTSFGSTTASQGPQFTVQVVDKSGDPIRAGEKAGAGVQRVMALSRGRW